VTIVEIELFVIIILLAVIVDKLPKPFTVDDDDDDIPPESAFRR
jgi:hypothetical protein